MRYMQAMKTITREQARQFILCKQGLQAHVVVSYPFVSQCPKTDQDQERLVEEQDTYSSEGFDGLS